MEENNLTIGDYLIKQRQEKGFSLVNISQYTRINISVLEKLEANDFSKLPNKTYLKGFVRAYVKAINADEKMALQLLDQTYDSLNKGPTLEQSNALKEEKERVRYAPIIFISFSIAFLLIIGGYLTYYHFNKAPKNPEVAFDQVVKEEDTVQSDVLVATPASTAPELVAVATATATPTPTATATATPTPAPTVAIAATPTPKPTLAPTPLYTPKPIATALVQEVSNGATPKEVARKVDGEEIVFQLATNTAYTYQKKPENLDELLPIPFQKAVSSKKQSIYINAYEGDSWITYKKDNDPIKKFVLKKGRYLFIIGDEIRLFVGNVQSSRIFYNNKLLSIDPKNGVKSLVFPESSWGKYHLPLFVYLKSGQVITSDEFLKAQ